MAERTKEAQERADAAFKKKQLQAREGAEAMAEYHAKNKALTENTARLKELRLTKEASDKAAEAAAPKPAKKRAAKKKAKPAR